MPRARISNDTKTRTVAAHNEGRDYQETARILNVKPGTAWSIVRRSQRNLGVGRGQRGGARNNKVDREMIDACVEIVQDHPEFTLQQIKVELHNRLPNKPQVCISTISTMLHGELITVKKLENVVADRNRDDVKMARLQYAEWLVTTHGNG